MSATTNHTNPRPSFASVVPPTPGEAAAATARWERRGVLQRLVRVN